MNTSKDAGLDVSPDILRRKASRVSSSRSISKRDNQRRKDTKTAIEDEQLLTTEGGTRAGKLSIPIPLRPGQVWHVQLDEGYSVSDVKRFMKILQMVLLEDAEEDDEEIILNGEDS